MQGAQGPQGAQGAQGIQGNPGATGADGYSPTVTVSSNTADSYVLQITDRNGSYLTPNLRASQSSGISAAAGASIYSANLANTGSTLSVPVGNMIYTVNNLNAGSVRVSLGAASGSVLADVKKLSQVDSGAMDSSSWDNTTFTTTPIVIDNEVFARSNEYHVTRIRQRDPATGLWSIYEVNLYPSASGERTNVWVRQIASGLSM